MIAISLTYAVLALIAAAAVVMYLLPFLVAGCGMPQISLPSP